MAISGVGHNYDYLGTTTNYIRGKATVREAISKTVKQSENLSISDEGRNMLREMASKFEPDSDYTNVRAPTIQNTNEVAWEHYTAMRDISSLTLKDGNYNVEDVMKSIMDTYETRYNEIVKEHENGKDKKNNDRPRCPSKPVMCSYGSNFVTIELPPDVIFAEIEISSDNNIIISGDITQDYPTLNFAELTGNYTIVLNTHSDDSTVITYIGELIF